MRRGRRGTKFFRKTTLDRDKWSLDEVTLYIRRTTYKPYTGQFDDDRDEVCEHPNKKLLLAICSRREITTCLQRKLPKYTLQDDDSDNPPLFWKECEWCINISID
ncbi:unnamed protein product [Didymodactylos carnosus]|uniref:Uncharacterized protein n=1 Tax=Didymodactylos carnosus TaxID=1234261 RepID=A0A8S2DXZ3_9BILA|nr:unnamed protein product [Didymodactylos carnosus]CAF3797938.1 unnamed protein product [Didymodactylos carnosus]